MRAQEFDRATPTLVAWRRAGVAVVLLCAAAVAAGGIAFRGQSSPSAFDAAVYARLRSHVSESFLDGALRVTTPGAVVGVVALIAVVTAFLRRYRLAVLAAGGPLSAAVLTEFVLKPVVGRKMPDAWTAPGAEGIFAYPSGHETGLTGVSVLVVIVTFALTTRRVIRAAVAVLAAAAVVLGGIALAGVGDPYAYHYATDVMAGACVAVVTVLGLALVLDHPRLAARRGPPPGDHGADAVSAPAARVPSSTAREA